MVTNSFHCYCPMKLHRNNKNFSQLLLSNDSKHFTNENIDLLASIISFTKQLSFNHSYNFNSKKTNLNLIIQSSNICGLFILIITAGKKTTHTDSMNQLIISRFYFTFFNFLFICFFISFSVGFFKQ